MDEITNPAAPLLRAAEQLAEAEFSILPTGPDKVQTLPTWKQYQSEIINTDDIPQVFRGCYGIAVICGPVSGGAECLDFDPHGHNIEDVFNAWKSDPGVQDILNRHHLYIERSPSGGYHVFYRYEADQHEGSQKLANWPDGDSKIETKGAGGYVVVSPTPGYIVLSGSLPELRPISIEERDYLLSVAQKFNEYERQQGEADPTGGHEITDPVSWFNWFKGEYTKRLLEKAGWVRLHTNSDGVEHWRRPGKDEGTSGTWGKKHNCLYVFSSSAAPFNEGVYYSPFQILIKLRFDGEYVRAINWIVEKYFDEGEIIVEESTWTGNSEN